MNPPYKTTEEKKQYNNEASNRNSELYNAR